MKISKEQYNKLPLDLRGWFEKGMSNNTHPT